MANTRKPNGLTIVREGMKFTCSWKIIDVDYDRGIQFRRRTNLTAKGKWDAESGIYEKSTSIDFWLTAANYYPTKAKYLTTVTFQVRGRRKTVVKDDVRTEYEWSDWAEKSFTINVPNVPSLTQELDPQLDNVTKFTWDTAVSNSDSKHFVGVEWQRMLIKACKQTDGSKLAWKSSQPGWGTGTGGANSSMTVTEDSTGIANDSYTRWVRIRSRGARGASAWRYQKHIYAKPYKPVIKTVTTAYSNGITTVYFAWDAKADAVHPVDRDVVQYTICVPASGQTVPVNASWTDVAEYRDTSGSDGARFTIEGAPGQDEIMFVRVYAEHDRTRTYSDAKIARRGSLEPPDIDEIETGKSGGTCRVHITVSHNSDVPDSRTAVVYRVGEDSKTDVVIGVLSHGVSEATFNTPIWPEDVSIRFGVYEFQGDAVQNTKSAGAYNYNNYKITANMKSGMVWYGGYVPREPTNVQAVATNREGEVKVTFSWPWTVANCAEISWSDNPNGWESTQEPQTYMRKNTHVAGLYVSGLATGKVWYFRVRLAHELNDNITYSPYSDIVSCDLSVAPDAPMLTLSAPVVKKTDKFAATWNFVSADGTPQNYAEIREATVSGDTVTIGAKIGSVTTAQRMTIAASRWNTGTTHYLVLRVSSKSGRFSAYSDPVPITVADPITCEITDTSLEEITIPGDQEDRTVMAITEMPLTATITGAGVGGTTTLIIERSAEYHMTRPDGSELDGYAGETIALVRQDGEDEIEVNIDDLIGLLDDGASYKLIAETKDGYGQTAQAEIDFEVHWEHQAEIPSATVAIEEGIAKITATAPASAEEGDVCDIYRLSADAPELIVQNGVFGVTYVDPYPTTGILGGHRIVHRTVNGDYITEDGHPAWTDYGPEDGDYVDEYSIIIDFNGRQLVLEYDITMSNDWEKDFKLTRYSGGSIKGDWNPGVKRKSSYTFRLLADEDEELIRGLRELSEYCGACHIRTPEGSSYPANIQVSENKTYEEWDAVSFTLSVTRVDLNRLDGIAYEEWVENELE